jgi:hypothetical protein
MSRRARGKVKDLGIWKNLLPEDQPSIAVAELKYKQELLDLASGKMKKESTK